MGKLQIYDGFMAALAKLKNQETAEAEYALRSGSAHTLREVVDTFDPVYGTSLHYIMQSRNMKEKGAESSVEIGAPPKIQTKGIAP